MDKIKCSECDGSGKVKCTTCSESGKVVCKPCKGVGHVTCPTCGGKGKKYVKCPSCHDGYNIDPDDDRKVKCAKCNGTGKIECGNCADCKGTGKIPCKSCAGSGKVACSDCHGEGKVTCSQCHGEGGLDVEKYCLSMIGSDGFLSEDFVSDELLEKVADAGNGVVAYVLGQNACLDEGGEEDCMKYTRISAKADFIWGNFELGRLLFYKNDPTAVPLLQRAKEQGSVLAAGYLGLITYFGRCGVTRDAIEAVALCRAYKGSIFEKEDYPHVCDIVNFMKYLESAVSGNADSQAWVAASAKALLPDGNEKEILEILREAVAKGAQNIDQVYRKGGLSFADGEIKAFKEQYDQERKRKEDEAAKAKAEQAKGASGSPTTKRQPEKVKDGHSPKKRWKFIVLGLLFGWMGAHYLYAKRMLLAILLWASFIAGVALCGKMAVVGGGCMALWVLLWIGGTFFVKKDGKGNRM